MTAPAEEERRAGALRVAWGCLTILPGGARGPLQGREAGGAFFWFPVIGLLIGVLLAGLATAAAWVFPPPLVAGGVLVGWVGLTGALHLDGLGDVCDGLYGGATREDRLRIMKDPHVGAMAVVAIVMVIVVKGAALSVLARPALITAVLLAPCLGRSAMVLLGTTLPDARAGQGTASPFIQHARRAALVTTAAMSVAVAWLLLGRHSLLVLGLALLLSVSLRSLFARTLGGVTGDALGATGELTEVVVLAGVAGLQGP